MKQDKHMIDIDDERLIQQNSSSVNIVGSPLRPKFYVMKLGIHDKVYNEAVEDFDPQNMTEYIEYYFPKGAMGIKALNLEDKGIELDEVYVAQRGETVALDRETKITGIAKADTICDAQLVIVYRKDPQLVAQEQALYEAQRSWMDKLSEGVKPFVKTGTKMLAIVGKGLWSATKMLFFTANRVSGGGTHVITFRHQVAQLERSHLIGGEPVSSRYNTLASKLVGTDVFGEAFLCCMPNAGGLEMTETVGKEAAKQQFDAKFNELYSPQRLVAFGESRRVHIERVLERIFEHQRTIEFVFTHTVRRLIMKTKDTETVFTNAIRDYLGDEEILKIEYNKINADESWDMHYRSKSGNYFIACNQDTRRENVLVSIFKRVDSLDCRIDKIAREKLEYNEALEILNGRFGNVRVATSKMLEEIVKAYLDEHGYEYKKAIPIEEFENPQDYSVLHSRDHVYVTPYGETYYASVELVDNTWLHIDLEEGRKTVHMEVYREALRKLYDGSQINYAV